MKREDLKNNVRIVGELIEKEVRRNKVGTEDETISLDVLVRVSDVEEHRVSFFAYKYTKNKEGKREINKDKISKLFTGYETIEREFVALSDKENQNERGELVEIKGSLSKNIYVDKFDQLREFVGIKGTFCSRVKEEKYNPLALWEAHVHITDIKENQNADKTGEYTLVKGIVVDYIENEFEFRIYREKVNKGFLRIFTEGDSVKLDGNIVNRLDEAVAVDDNEEGGWGDEMEETASVDTVRRKYLEIITGANRPLDTDDEDHPLNEEKIKEYKRNIKERKSDIVSKHEADKLKEKESKRNIDPNVGTNDFDEEEIPF